MKRRSNEESLSPKVIASIHAEMLIAQVGLCVQAAELSPEQWMDETAIREKRLNPAEKALYAPIHKFKFFSGKCSLSVSVTITLFFSTFLEMSSCFVLVTVNVYIQIAVIPDHKQIRIYI